MLRLKLEKLLLERRYKILIAKLIKNWRTSLQTGMDSSPPEVLYQDWMSQKQFHYFLLRLLDLIQESLGETLSVFC